MYKVKPHNPDTTKDIIDCVCEGLWIGYKTNGGNIAILMVLEVGKYGFITNRNFPVFIGKTREESFLRAYEEGRVVMAAETLSKLEEALGKS